ncbi:glycolate oxidase [Dethiosulfatibacter aminovorans DSM 17477]|uniref:Glycolate oxidase n=1 Tax=Dethiosulfatibacter aminovorans DSM 17477 TaxID=1121476 RepID=A0A1M6IQI2_9FIRM|nr:FAD-linked oxidase C-terminal domain-containing protein [Dethiosulfatibacter aminovorans]SHJ36710.1 glycolate oxidase [Dethiosulfatibacter aminovorans DSM 17477]
MNYNPITKEILEELTGILGAKNVIVDKEKMENYSHDETPKEYAHMPDVVITPRTAEEISEVVKLANRHLIPITPRGAGSGLSGGAIPTFGGILLSIEKMNKVIEVDYDNMMIVVEPGLVTNEINAIVDERGLFYAGYPMSLLTCYIGGNIAENAGGGKAIKYGVTGRYVMGLEVVTPTGEIVQMGGKNVKDVTGYDLKRLMIGSEGTLGIITKAILKLSPKPKFATDLLVLFEDADSAIKMVPKIISESRIIPTSVEFMDKLSVHTTCDYLNEQLPYQKAGSMLLIEVDGTVEENVNQDAETIGELCLENNAIEVYVADNYTTQERVWSVRRNIAEAFMVYSPEQSLEDIVVPIANIAKLMPEIEKISERYDIKMPSYGHAGDGNLHTTLVKNPDTTMEEWFEIEEKALQELYTAVYALGGKLSGEHGIGIKRKKYMKEHEGEAELMLMKKIKMAFDPNNIMNPGKIID